MWLNELIWAKLNSILCLPATDVSLVGDLQGNPNHSPLRHLPPQPLSLWMSLPRLKCNTILRNDKLESVWVQQSHDLHGGLIYAPAKRTPYLCQGNYCKSPI